MATFRGGPVFNEMPPLVRACKYIELLCPYDQEAVLMGDAAAPIHGMQRRFGPDCFDFCTATDLEAISAIMNLGLLVNKHDQQVPVVEAFLAAEGPTRQAWDRLLYFIVDPPYLGTEARALPGAQEADFNQGRSFERPAAGPVFLTELMLNVVDYALPLLSSLLLNAESRRRMFATANEVYLNALEPQLERYRELMTAEDKDKDLLLFFANMIRFVRAERSPAAEPGTAAVCAYCAADVGRSRCSRCRQAAYCSKGCQVYDWKFRHKKACPGPPAA